MLNGYSEQGQQQQEQTQVIKASFPWVMNIKVENINFYVRKC